MDGWMAKGIRPAVRTAEATKPQDEPGKDLGEAEVAAAAVFGGFALFAGGDYEGQYQTDGDDQRGAGQFDDGGEVAGSLAVAVAGGDYR